MGICGSKKKRRPKNNKAEARNDTHANKDVNENNAYKDDVKNNDEEIKKQRSSGITSCGVNSKNEEKNDKDSECGSSSKNSSGHVSNIMELDEEKKCEDQCSDKRGDELLRRPSDKSSISNYMMSAKVVEKVDASIPYTVSSSESDDLSQSLPLEEDYFVEENNHCKTTKESIENTRGVGKARSVIKPNKNRESVTPVRMSVKAPFLPSNANRLSVISETSFSEIIY